MKTTFINSILLTILFCLGCVPDKLEEQIINEHSITLIQLGPKYKEFNKIDTKGFGVHSYYYVDLNSDSIFIQNKSDYKLPVTVKFKTGNEKGISEVPYIKSAIKEIEKLPEGLAMGNTRQVCFKSNRLPYALVYKKEGKIKQFFFCKIYANSPIGYLTSYLPELVNRETVKPVEKPINFNEDSILSSLIIAKGFDSLNAPPPHLNITIKFMPPVKGYEKDSAQKP